MCLGGGSESWPGWKLLDLLPAPPLLSVQSCFWGTNTPTHPWLAGSAEETAVLQKLQEKSPGGEGSGSPPWLMPEVQEEAEQPFLLARIQTESSLVLGQDAKLLVTVANRSGQERPLQVVLGAQPLQYNGRTLAQFWKEEFQVTLGDGHGKSRLQHCPGTPKSTPLAPTWGLPGL